MIKSLKRFGALMLVAGVLLAQVPVKVTNGSGAEIAMGASGNRYLSEIAVVANSLTSVTTSATYVQLLFCMNNTASAATLDVTNTAGTNYFQDVSISGNTAMLLHASTIGLYMNGIKLGSNTSSALYCQIQGVQ